MMSRVLVVGALAAVLAVLGSGLASAAAPAGYPCVTLHSKGEDVAAACFNASGDHVYAVDLAKDGYHVAAYWSFSRTYSGVCEFDLPGDQSTAGKLRDCNYDFPEHATFTMRAATLRGDKIIDITPPKTFSTS